MDFTNVEDLLWDISKAASHTGSVKIAAVRSHQADFMWRVTERSLGGQDANVAENVNLTIAVRALLARLEVRKAECAAALVCLSPSAYHVLALLIVTNFRLDGNRVASMRRRHTPPVLGCRIHHLATSRSMVTTDLAVRQLCRGSPRRLCRKHLRDCFRRLPPVIILLRHRPSPANL